MHIQHIESTSGHIGNISGSPLPPTQYKVSIRHICHKAHSFKRVGLVQGGHKHHYFI